MKDRDVHIRIARGFIEVDPDRLKKFVAKSPEHDPSNERAHNTVWHNDSDGTVDIDFEDGGPFEGGSSFSIMPRGQTQSGVAREHTQDQSYKYTVRLVIDGREMEKDPEIEVTPGGPSISRGGRGGSSRPKTSRRTKTAKTKSARRGTAKRTKAAPKKRKKAAPRRAARKGARKTTARSRAKSAKKKR